MEKTSQKFTSFIKTCKIFKVSAEDKLKKDLTKEFDKFIKDKNVDGLSLLIESGYQPTKKQAINIMAQIEEKNQVITDSMEKIYDEAIKYDILKDIKKFHRLTKTVGFDLAYDLTNQSSKSAIIEYHTCFDDNALFKDKKYALEFLSLSKEMASTCERNYTYTLSKIITYSICAIEEMYENEMKEELEKNNSDTASKYASVLPSFDNVKKQMVSNLKEFQESDLPRNCKPIFNDIKSTYAKIDLEKVTLTQKLEVELLYNKRLPEVLHQYLVISPEYKATLKSHSVNPDNILLDSLNEIKTKIVDVWTDIEDQNFKKMKTTNKYLKTI